MTHCACGESYWLIIATALVSKGVSSYNTTEQKIQKNVSGHFQNVPKCFHTQPHVSMYPPMHCILAVFTRQLHHVHLQAINNLGSSAYRIAGNFRGANFSWISWFEACARKFYPRILEPRPFMKQCACSYHENITHEISHLLKNTKILSLENYPLYGITACASYILGTACSLVLLWSVSTC